MLPRGVDVAVARLVAVAPLAAPLAVVAVALDRVVPAAALALLEAPLLVLWPWRLRRVGSLSVAPSTFYM